MLIELEQAKLQALWIQGGERERLGGEQATKGSCCSRRARLKLGEEPSDP